MNKWLLIKNDMIDLLNVEIRLLQAPSNRPMRKRSVPLDSGKPLFLCGSNDRAIDQERSRGIVVVGGNPQDRRHVNN